MDATLNLSKLAKPFNDETATRELLKSMAGYEEHEQLPEAQKRTLKKYAKVGGKKQTA